MTLQMTFQSALKLLNQKEEDLLEQARQVRERKTQLLGALKFLRMLELVNFPEHPREEDKNDPVRISPEALSYIRQTGFVRNPSKLPFNSSGRAETPQLDSIYERAIQLDSIYERAIQKARDDMAEESLRSETLFQGNLHEASDYDREAAYQEIREGIRAQQESLNAKVGDPSEWLLNQANDSRDEILAGSSTLQELLDNLGGIGFNQDTIREFLAGLINFDLIAKEPSKLNRTANDRSSRSPADDYRSSFSPADDYWSSLNPVAVADYQSSHVRGPAAPDSLMELRPDFRKTANLGENMERVGAAARGKTLSPNEVAKLLIHQGMYRAKMDSLRYRVRQIMRNNPLQYEKVDEDAFLFIGHVPDIGRTPGHPPD